MRSRVVPWRTPYLIVAVVAAGVYTTAGATLFPALMLLSGRGGLLIAMLGSLCGAALSLVATVLVVGSQLLVWRFFAYEARLKGDTVTLNDVPAARAQDIDASLWVRVPWPLRRMRTRWVLLGTTEAEREQWRRALRSRAYGTGG